MSDVTAACCSCLRVEYRPEEVVVEKEIPGTDECPPVKPGTRLNRDCWVCSQCGRRFYPVGLMMPAKEAEKMARRAWAARLEWPWTEAEFGEWFQVEVAGRGRERGAGDE